MGDTKHTIPLETVSKSSAGTSKTYDTVNKRAIGDTKHTIPLETVSKSSAGTDKTHDTVNKKSDRRHKTYDSFRDCQQNERSEAIWRDLGRRSQIPRKRQDSKSLIKSFVKCCRKHDFKPREARDVFEVPGDSSQRRRQAILTRLSAKAAPGLAKRTKLSAK